jgi:hypothetical protein
MSSAPSWRVSLARRSGVSPSLTVRWSIQIFCEREIVAPSA